MRRAVVVVWAPLVVVAAAAFGAEYRVLGSTDLSNWQPLGVVTNTYGTSQFTDEGATNTSVRFYRAVTP